MWAFGLLLLELLELVGGCRPHAQVDACLTTNPEKTRAYAMASSLLCLDPGWQYYEKVSSPACKLGCSLLALAMMAYESLHQHSLLVSPFSALSVSHMCDRYICQTSRADCEHL